MPSTDRLSLAFIGDPASVIVQRWITFFARRGHAVSVLEGFGNGASVELDERIRVIRYDARGSLRLPFVSALHARRVVRGLLGELQPDVVHAHTVRPYGRQAAVAGYHPYVVSAWGSDVLIPVPGWRARFWQHRTLSQADLVTAVSPYMREAAIRGGAVAERVVEIQFGVDTRRYVPADVPAGSLRHLGLDGRPYVFSPRAVKPLYNHETILEAFSSLGDGHQLVMTRRNAEPAHLEWLTTEMTRRGIRDRVRIVEDASDDDMLALYQGAGVVVSAPLSDSFPISLLEAMACGAPVVAGDLPPVRAVLEGAVPASIVPTHDAEAMAIALRRMLAMSQEERRRLGAALRKLAVETADYEANMLRMEGLYRELARRR
ncbi:MAG: glycosyltransferase [Chloroflexota bacterium]|nr:glycosyltransferase [Chloroflexota bacterium]